MRIESYDLRMDSATAKSYETTRKLTLGYKVGSRGQTDGLAGDTFLGAYNNSPDKKEYQNIVRILAQRNDIQIDDAELMLEANKWEMSHGGFSGRSAQQFIDYLLGKQ